MVKGLEKAVLLNCIEVIRYCKNEGLDLNKLKSCKVEKMFDEYVFGLLKKSYDDDSDWYLHEDLSTQPDIVLIVAHKGDEVVVRGTGKTYLLR